MPESARTLVVIPTYDEVASLERTIDAVLDAVPEADVLVVDDASPDGTGDLAVELAAEDPRIRVLHRVRKAGLGPAYLDAFAWARRAGYEFVAEFDADGSHPALRLPALLDAVRADARCGVAIGSRWVPGGRVVDWPWHRRALSRWANVYARLALGVPVRDLTAGFRVYRMSALERIDVGSVDSIGYCFQVDLTLRVLDAGWGVIELPIVFRERTEGVSKMTGGIVLEAMGRVTRWAWERRTASLRRRIAARRSPAPTGTVASTPADRSVRGPAALHTDAGQIGLHDDGLAPSTDRPDTPAPPR